MNDAFAQIISPVAQYVIEFQRGLERGENPTIDQVKTDLIGLIGEAEQKAAVARDLAANFALAKYALVYWSDEVLINSRWSHADEWRNHILEWEYYRENVGGEKFYDKAEEAERLADTDPLEVFFQCVALGFQGKLGFNRTELQRWVERAYGRIASGSQQPDRFLPDEPRDAEPAGLVPLPGKTVLLAVSVLVSITALLTLAGFILTVQWTY